MEMNASLREAARRSGIPEEQLRRRILTGELAAEPVDDDRQYLVRLEDLGIAAAPAAGPRPVSGAPLFYLKIAFALFLLAMTGAIVTTACPPRCSLRNLDRQAIAVEAARRVDPEGAIELIRWCRENGRRVTERVSFATKEEFRAWFEGLRARLK